jgi:hypothetical protein
MLTQPGLLSYEKSNFFSNPYSLGNSLDRNPESTGAAKAGALPTTYHTNDDRGGLSEHTEKNAQSFYNTMNYHPMQG